MTSFEVREILPHEFDTWDEFVRQSGCGTLFHTSSWKKVIDTAYAPAHYLLVGCFDGPAIVGGCAALSRQRMGHSTAVTPLLTPYCGYVVERPLGEKISDQSSREASILESTAAFMKQQFQYQKLINAPHLEDARGLQRSGYELTPRFTYCINLKLPVDELWARLDGSVRRQIKKAREADFEISNILEPAEGFRLYAQVFEKHGAKCPVDAELFNAVVTGESLHDFREVIAARRDGKLVSYIVLLRFDQTMYYALAATDPGELASGASSYLVWHVIETYANREWNTYDFVGANIESIARFKEGFNPKLVTYLQAEHFGAAYLKLGKSLRDMLKD